MIYENPLLNIQGLTVRFPWNSGLLFKRRFFNALHEVCLTVRKNETFCLIGESGSGKTTLVWAILGLHKFHNGRIFYKGQIIQRYNDTVHRRLRANSQMVFQDVNSSLNPFLTLAKAIEEPMAARGMGKEEREAMVRELAIRTGLEYELLDKRPLEVSTGQNQRACIARALSTAPEILFLDEPLSGIDPVIQGQIKRLLMDMKYQHDLTYFLISHDLDLVKRIGSTVAVMYFGRIVEQAPKDLFFSCPLHPYSQAILSSVLKPGVWHGPRIVLEGQPPAPYASPAGCVYHPRCHRQTSVCHREVPGLKEVGEGHYVCCHLC